ncbi:MAG: isoamylase early set domain-containing protein [Gemmatimonadaceae bacterium]
MTDEQDEMIERISAALRPLPEVDASARARVLVAVAAERERDRATARRVRSRRRWWVRGAGLAAASALSVVLLRGYLASERAAAPSAPGVATSPAGAGGATVLATHGAVDAAARQPVQFVFRAPLATRVSVVGDFTGWNPDSAVMTRDAASGLWSVTLALTPGRHVYAFLLDDSVWVRDPRAPAAPDADFGRPGSVLLVGRP